MPIFQSTGLLLSCQQCCQVNFFKNPNIALKKSQDSLFFPEKSQDSHFHLLTSFQVHLITWNDHYTQSQKDTQMCNSVYFAYDSLSHGLRHFHTHFWQVHLFEFQYKCITEKCILPFYKRPGQKHNFICCLKCAGQLPFINICEPRQSCGKFS